MFDLKYFGVIFSDSNDDNNACQTVVLVFTAAITMVILPFIELEFDFDDWSEAFSTSISLLICSTVIAGSLISHAIVAYNVCRYKIYSDGQIRIPIILHGINWVNFILKCENEFTITSDCHNSALHDGFLNFSVFLPKLQYITVNR